MEEVKQGCLLIVIINKGFSDIVMEAARASGARGGTIFTARGTGNPNIEKFFGIPIQEQKEMIFIIVKPEIKEKCLKEIYKSAGLETKGQGIIFSINVGDMIGFNPVDEKQIEKKE